MLIEEHDDETWEQIIHDPCGLPVELCQCRDAQLRPVKTWMERGGEFAHHIRMAWYRFIRMFK